MEYVPLSSSLHSAFLQGINDRDRGKPLVTLSGLVTVTRFTVTANTGHSHWFHPGVLLWHILLTNFRGKGSSLDVVLLSAAFTNHTANRVVQDHSRTTAEPRLCRLERVIFLLGDVQVEEAAWGQERAFQHLDAPPPSNEARVAMVGARNERTGILRGILC